MKATGARPRLVVSISISESPDMPVLGMSDQHLQDAMYEIATHLLANGADLAYGGDLRPGGFTELLFELLYRYGDGTGGGCNVTNYLAWPVHIGMAANDIDETVSWLRHIRLRLVGRDGGDISVRKRQRMTSRQPDEWEWPEGLTAMRRTMCSETDARVALGGRVQDYSGRMPGVAEEVLLSLESRRPVFLLGGFGGCTRDIAETLGLVDRWAGSRPAWPGRGELERYGAEDLWNGLSLEENRALAGSPHMGQAVPLILRGICRLRTDKHHKGRYRKE
ncbi:MAG: hypothetical protein J4G04_06195 [Nitrosopumilaceae archaeon]|nr:hypothetical protein [Nitrosopumilaceae archaeon]